MNTIILCFLKHMQQHKGYHRNQGKYKWINPTPGSQHGCFQRKNFSKLTNCGFCNKILTMCYLPIWSYNTIILCFLKTFSYIVLLSKLVNIKFHIPSCCCLLVTLPLFVVIYFFANFLGDSTCLWKVALVMQKLGTSRCRLMS